jgi:hypothetical protein
MASDERSYGTARTLFGFLEIVSRILVLRGGVVVIAFAAGISVFFWSFRYGVSSK